MPPVKVVFQTLEERDSDLNELEQNGPYPCRWENTWLGDGFYFWDTFIDNAHWWGEIRDYPDGYIICQAECDDFSPLMFDLVGNTNHILEFRKTYDLMRSKGLIKKSTTVKRVISYLKDEMGYFEYEAIRAYGIRSKNFHSRFNFILQFETKEDSRQYLDFTLAIQICFFNRNSLNLRDYRVVYPDEYNEDYLA